MNKQDSALNTRQRLICCKAEPTNHKHLFNRLLYLKPFTVCKQMSSGTFKNIIYEVFT